MFSTQKQPRVFAAPVGVDFLQSLKDGLHQRLKNCDPDAWINVEIYLTTHSARRRLQNLFLQDNVRFIPKIRLLSELEEDAHDLISAPPVLRRKLELSRLIKQFIAHKGFIAPSTDAFGLAESLNTLLDEIEENGLKISDIAAMDVSDQSGHWQNTLEFFKILQTVYEDENIPSVSQRQRQQIQKLIHSWQITPPQNPIIVAGSTGSRQTTFDFMQAVSKLPQGALILPAFDFSMTAQAWGALAPAVKTQTRTQTPYDHPQYQFSKLLHALSLSPKDVQHWANAQPAHRQRCDILSLSLRPAPVTRYWRKEGASLTDVASFAQNVTWVEAKDQKSEANTIALRLHKGVELGQTVAVITTDRILARHIAAALSRWDIKVDDGAGIPLSLSAPGRFLQHALDLAHSKMMPDRLMALLKHPLCHSGAERGIHLHHTRAFEIYLRTDGPAFISPATVQDWAQKEGTRAAWADWLIKAAFAPWPKDQSRIKDWLTHHMNQAKALAQGISGKADPLWAQKAGQTLKTTLNELMEHGDAAGDIPFHEYRSLLQAHLAATPLRPLPSTEAKVFIWGTSEARAQGADLIILAGLNEGSWPQTPPLDPWLNRQMRAQVGLPVPDQRIGLAAHDYQQAMGANEVWISRALRTGDAPTIPSRWINRLENLLGGLSEQGGAQALKQMKQKGVYWTRTAAELDKSAPMRRVKRPNVCPPPHTRPKKLSVTKIKTLIRDPYAIYAERILRLKPLEPLQKEPDALLRGTAIHQILEDFIAQWDFDNADAAQTALLALAQKQLAQYVPWPSARRLWQARIARIAAEFVAQEMQRRKENPHISLETPGKIDIREADFTLTCKADRIDRLGDGSAYIYDYKTGKPPTKDQQLKFDKQLLLEAEILKKGGFKNIPPSPPKAAYFIGLGNSLAKIAAPLDEPNFWQDFVSLLQKYRDPAQGYIARRAMFKSEDFAPYDHLSRYGEWDTTQDSERIKVHDHDK